jgi:hypothetical protein
MNKLQRSAYLDALGGSVLALLIMLGTAGLPSCKTTGAGGVGARVIDCAQKAIQEKGLVYVGKVNDILGNTGVSDDAARARLIDLGIDAGQDVLGCLLADQGQKFAESAAKNPADDVSHTAAKRAKTRLLELEAEGWRFDR